MIEVRELAVARGGASVLRAVSLTWERGVLALVGPNGCGKSTLLLALCGVLAPSRGEIVIDGHSLATERSRAQARCALVPEEPGYPAHLTVREIAELCAALREAALPDDARSLAALELLGGRAYGALSLGQRKRAHRLFARAGAPPWWLLDEPSDGLDDAAREDLFDELRTRPVGAIVATHDAALIALADGVARLADGALVRER